MITQNIQEFKDVVSKTGRLMALDMGKKRIGIATSDENQIIASPFQTYERQNMNKDLGFFRRIINEEHITALVIGLPLELDGSESEFCQDINHFANKLQQKVDLPILCLDERLTTAAVTRTMKDAGVKRKDRHQKDDELAATYLLQTLFIAPK